jgi:hypothetical protein
MGATMMEDGIGKTEIEMLERIVEMAGDRLLTAFRCLGRIQIEKAEQGYTEAVNSLATARKSTASENSWHLRSKF